MNKSKEILSKYRIYFVFLGLVLFFSIITQGRFLQISNIFNVMRQVSIVGLIAYGVTLIIITTGIDLSSGAILALISVVIASLLQTGASGTFIKYPNLPQLPIILPILIALILGLLLGSINGSLVVWAKIPPFIATLGMFITARGFAFIYANGRPISTLNPIFKERFGQGFTLAIPNPVLIFIFMGIVTYIILSHTRLGRYIYAIGANRKAAYVSGINTDLCLLFVYAYAGLLTAIATIVQTARIDSGQAGLGISFELYAIASAVIGGTSLTGGIGTITGTFVGALIIGIIRNGMDMQNIPADWQQVVLGAIIIIAVIIDQRKNKMKS